jgi:hypothetical protein
MTVDEEFFQESSKLNGPQQSAYDFYGDVSI